MNIISFEQSTDTWKTLKQLCENSISFLGLQYPLQIKIMLALQNRVIEIYQHIHIFLSSKLNIICINVSFVCNAGLHFSPPLY